MLKPKHLFLSLIFLLSAIILWSTGCANQQPPHGGPKDVTPPHLLRATPGNMTRKFAAKSVLLEFDEYFKLNNQYTEITMSPTPDKQPEYKIKGKNLLINFKDTLQKNTTYVINFGKAIQDLHEGNTLQNFTYVFSTGSHIDSLSVSGTVTNSLTQKREKDITVMLFPIEKDSAYFGKKKPNIYAQTDTGGNFSMNNLHEGTYRIYALKETAPDKIYNRDDELIGFLKKPVKLYTDTSDIQLTLFQQVPEKFRLLTYKFDVAGNMIFIFNRPLNNPSLKILYPPALDAPKIVEFSKTRDTALLYSKNMDFDSLRVAILENNKPLDTIYKLKQRKEEFRTTYSFSLNLTGYQGLLKPHTPLRVTSSLPIESFDPSLITLTEDSVAIAGYTLKQDSAYSKKFTIDYHFKPDAKYAITFEDNAFVDIYGIKSKRFYKKFQLDKEDNYSTLTLHVTVPDTSKSYIVQFYPSGNPKTIIQSDRLSKNGDITYKNIITGKYNISVIYDDNKNGRWDSGSVKEKRYPENIWIDAAPITLRPNFDEESKLDIPREQYSE